MIFMPILHLSLLGVRYFAFLMASAELKRKIILMQIALGLNHHSYLERLGSKYGIRIGENHTKYHIRVNMKIINLFDN
jgi:hypothetical protein